MALSRIIRIANGSTDTFAVDFALGYLQESDVAAYVLGELDGGGNQIYRAITFLDGGLMRVAGGNPPGGSSVVFDRTVPKDALRVDFVNGDLLNEENLNAAFEHVWHAVHEALDGRITINGDLNMQGFKLVNVGYPTDNSDATNMQFVIDYVAANVSPGSALWATIAEAEAGTATDRSMSPALVKAALQYRTLHLYDFIPYELHAGIRAGTYTGNVSPYLQAAVNRAQAENKLLVIDGGHFYCYETIEVPFWVNIVGIGWQESPLPSKGTWLIHANKSVPLFNFTTQNSRGSSLSNFAVFQEHEYGAPVWEPEAADWVFKHDLTYGGLDLTDIYTPCIRKGVHSDQSGRLRICRWSGQVFECLAEVDRALDVPNFHDVHLWPFWAGPGDVKQWMVDNHQTYRMFRTDTPIWSGKQFLFNGQAALSIGDNGYGTTTRFDISSFRAESFQNAVHVKPGANGVTGIIQHVDHFGEAVTLGTPITNSNSILMEGNDGHIQIMSGRGEIISHSYARLLGNGNQLDVSNWKGANHNMVSGGGQAAFHAANVVSGNVNRITLWTTPFIQTVGLILFNSATNAILNRNMLSGVGIDGINYTWDPGSSQGVLTASGYTANAGISMQSTGTGDFRWFVGGRFGSWLYQETGADTYNEWKLGNGYTQWNVGATGANAHVVITPKGAGGMGVGIVPTAIGEKLAVAGVIQSIAAYPAFNWYESDQVANQRLWRFGVAGGVLSLQIAADDQSSSSNILSFVRSGLSITNMQVNTNLFPASNNTRPLGSSALRWSQIHATAAYFYGLTDYADDTAAAAGGVAVGQLYRTGSIVKVRVV